MNGTDSGSRVALASCCFAFFLGGGGCYWCGGADLVVLDALVAQLVAPQVWLRREVRAAQQTLVGSLPRVDPRVG